MDTRHVFIPYFPFLNEHAARIRQMDTRHTCKYVGVWRAEAFVFYVTNPPEDLKKRIRGGGEETREKNVRETNERKTGQHGNKRT